MKKIYLAAILLISNFAISQVLYQESFETNTNGTNYNTSIAEFSDGFGDFFTRTDGSNITSSYSVTNIDGSFYFAGMDIDGEGASLPVELSTTSINVSGVNYVDFSVSLAEDDDGTSQDWDPNDSLNITYSIDGGAKQNLLWVRNDGSPFNGVPLIDTDFDGLGDGAEITSVFTEYTETIMLSGATTIQFFFETSLNSGDEDIAIDNIVVSENTTPTINATPNLLTGFQQFIGSPSAEQSFDVQGFNLTDDVVLTVTNGDYEISETSGGTFGNTITLTQSGGVVSATTIYVRLNGTVAQSPANGDITITSVGVTNEVVNLEGEILTADPTVFATPSALSGFSHFVGTPSAEQTIDVSGEFLTADITVTAPTNYEVSLTSGLGFGNSVTLTQSGGTVPSTPVYVRLNGASANYTQVGNIDVTSTNATTVQVALDGETLDYTPYDIGEVTANDANLSPDSLNVYVSLKGIVHCIDFEDGPGYSFTIIDDANDGINVFNFNDVNGYSSTEGDSITVKGQIGFFNGLTQIFAEEIILETQGNPIQTPTIVTDLDETTESQYVTMENLTFVNPQTNWSTGNVDVTDGNNTFVLRIESASPLVGTAAPNGPFDVTGIGGQYDNSGAPYDAGYQLYPCSVAPLCNVDITTATANAIITANASGAGVSYQWLDCDNNDLPIPNEMGQTFTPTTSGNYAVEITDGACVDTSNCVNVQVCNVDVTTTTTDLTIEANAAGLTYQWLDCNNNDEEIVGEDGQSFTATSNGNYAVIVTDGVCADTSECVAINTIGVDKQELSLSVYPNPVQNQLNIVSKGATIVEVKVISVTGKEISFVKSNENLLNMNTADWTTGVYFVEVKTNSGSKIVKVIK